MEGERTRISEHTYSPKVDVIIPTYKPGERFSRLFRVLGFQTYPVGRIIMMSTEKVYWNDKGYQGIPNMEVHHLSKAGFDRGATRNRDAHYSRADVITFVTNDAVPADEHLAGHPADAFKQRGPQGESVTMACVRQLPDRDYPITERYTRSFNYPEESCIKTEEDLERIGIKTFFASSACCVYDRGKFWFQDGFIAKTIFNEDMIFAGGAVLQDDCTITYMTEAKVIYSHNYGCAAQFRRNFDLAVSQTGHPEVFTGIRSESEGIHLVK